MLELFNSEVGFFLQSLIYAILLAFFPFLTYRASHKNIHREPLFEFTLILLVPIIFLIMHFIGTNIALSIGLVGSLSVVRFRTAIKSPKELTYILWAIAIGVGLGSQNIHLIALATIILAIFIYLVEKMIFNSKGSSGSMLLIKTPSEKRGELLEELNSLHPSMELVSVSENKTENYALISLQLKKITPLEKKSLYQQLHKNESISSLQYIEK
ncbi:MAG: hypothetical protein CME62_12030 [Halobacteriovoraceae bacterium]|nr:hypothetical protein [Halobacteriovoraceae bacterium]|tara:strand:+ start:38267 stop:38905 length:639 start_codon:yes stop_codon:yes gene_type:complete